MQAESSVGDLITAMDKLLTHDSDYAKWAQQSLGTSHIFPILSHHVMKILQTRTEDASADMKYKAEKIQQLSSQNHIIWATSPRFPINFAFDGTANISTACFKCRVLISFPINKTGQQLTCGISKDKIIFQRVILKTYDVVYVFCDKCGEEPMEKNK